MVIEERKATYLFAGSRPNSNSNSHHHDDMSSFDAQRLELMHRAQRAEAEETERRRSMRWRVLQNKQNQNVKTEVVPKQKITSASAASTSPTSTVITETPSKQRSISSSTSIRSNRSLIAANAAESKRLALLSLPEYIKRKKGNALVLEETAEVPSELSSLASLKPKEDVPVPPEAVTDQLSPSPTALGYFSFLTRWYTGNATGNATDTDTGTDDPTTGASTATTVITGTYTDTLLATNVAKEPVAPPAWNPYHSKKSSLHSFPSSPLWDNKTKMSSTTVVAPAVARTIQNNIKKKKIPTTPPAPNTIPPQVVMTAATPSSTIGTCGDGGGGIMDDDDYSLDSLTLFQLGHLMQGQGGKHGGSGGSGGSGSGNAGVHTPMFHEMKKKKSLSKSRHDTSNSVVLVLGAVLSLAFLVAAGSLFWILTSRYYGYGYATMGPVLTATGVLIAPPAPLPSEQPIEAVPDPTVVAGQTRSFAPVVPRHNRPAQEMIEDAVRRIFPRSQRLNSRGVVGPAGAWTWQVPVLTTPPDSVEGVSTILEQLRYGSLAREGRGVVQSTASSSSTLALLPTPAFELQQRLEQADVKRKPVAVVPEFDYFQNLDPVDLSTLLSNLNPSDETDLQMVSEGRPSRTEERTPVLAVSLPKCFAGDRWNQTMLSGEASQEFVLWAHFGFWRRQFASPMSAPQSPLQDAWPDFSANLEMMRFLTIMDPEYSIIPGKSCRSWDSLVDPAPSIKRIETLQDSVGGGGGVDDDGRDDFLHVPLVDVVGDFLRQKRQQMQQTSN